MDAIAHSQGQLTAPSGRRRDGKARRGHAPDASIGRRAWLAPVLGGTIIVLIGAAASLAQATPEVYVAASILFSLTEGVVLAFVGYLWSRRGPGLAALAGCITALLATPGRWEFASVRYGHRLDPMDLLTDLLVSLAWGALAGLAGATVLRARIAALTHSEQERFGRTR